MDTAIPIGIPQGVTANGQGQVTAAPASEVPKTSAPASSGGGTVTCDILIIGGYKIEPGDKGLYVTTPEGIRTKMELIDFRQTPIPTPAELILPVGVAQVSPFVIPSGPAKKGGQPGPGFAAGGPTSQGPQTSSGGGGGGGGGGGAPTPTPGGGGTGYQALSDANRVKLPYNLGNDTAFLQCLDSLAKGLNCSADNLVAVMWVESGLNAKAINPSETKASGLNQITSPTANNLGYKIEQIQAMSAAEQMCGPTTKYFNSVRLPANPTLVDLYLVNFYPVSVGKPDSYVIGPKGSKIVKYNAALADQNGEVTVGSTKEWLYKRLGASGLTPGT